MIINSKLLEHTQSQNFSNPTHLRGNSTENLFEMRPQTSPAVHHAENTFVLYSGITQSLKVRKNINFYANYKFLVADV